MEPTLEEQLEAIKRDLKKQHEAWKHAKEALARLDAASIAFPRDFFEQLESPEVRPTVGAVVHGLRG
jgi:hypothetical protein